MHGLSAGESAVSEVIPSAVSFETAEEDRETCHVRRQLQSIPRECPNAECPGYRIHTLSKNTARRDASEPPRSTRDCCSAFNFAQVFTTGRCGLLPQQFASGLRSGDVLPYVDRIGSLGNGICVSPAERSPFGPTCSRHQKCPIGFEVSALWIVCGRPRQCATDNPPHFRSTTGRCWTSVRCR